MSPPPDARVDPHEREQDDDADDRAHDAPEVEDVAVADAQPDGEDQVPEQRARKADGGSENSHELGPCSSLHMSGTSSRPTIPATSPVNSAPIIPVPFSRGPAAYAPRSARRDPGVTGASGSVCAAVAARVRREQRAPRAVGLCTGRLPRTALRVSPPLSVEIDRGRRFQDDEALRDLAMHLFTIGVREVDLPGALAPLTAAPASRKFLAAIIAAHPAHRT